MYRAQDAERCVTAERRRGGAVAPGPGTAFAPRLSNAAGCNGLGPDAHAQGIEHTLQRARLSCGAVRGGRYTATVLTGPELGDYSWQKRASGRNLCFAMAEQPLNAEEDSERPRPGVKRECMRIDWGPTAAVGECCLA
jgi:hypothetical protein